MKQTKAVENKELARLVNVEFPYLDVKQRQLIYLFALNYREDKIKSARADEREKIANDFNKLWNCLKFEKSGSKVIGYTFDKKDIDKFKQKLKEKSK